MINHRLAKVFHADLWGLREQKYEWLNAQNLQHTDWRELKRASPFYLFVPRDDALAASYYPFPPVTALFVVSSVGIVTSRDEFVIDFDTEALKRRIRQLRDPNMPDEVLRQAFKLEDKAGWRLTEARANVRADTEWEQRIVPCLYRPFDVRWLFNHPAVIERGRHEVMRHMLAGPNVALITSRLTKGETFRHAQVATSIAEVICMSPNTSNNGFVFPLYLYPTAEREELFARHEPSERTPNLNPKLIGALAEAHGREPTPEEIFHYVYAVLYAPSYREKYAEFLRMDFPRIPFTADREVFGAMAAFGGRLVALHLLKSPELEAPAARFEAEGDNVVAKGKKAGLRYDAAEQRVYINAAQYFAPVPQDVWDYQIGGYQVLHKWLKDRKERTLTLDEIRTYCHIVTAIRKTIEVQDQIDALYPEAEREVIELGD